MESLNKNIENIIFQVRGRKVILDRDLSDLLNIETRELNQKVKRNINLFSKSKYFQMTKEEFIDWKSQFVMSENDKIGLRRAPYVLTFEGIKVLSTILKPEKAKLITKIITETFENKNNNLKVSDCLYLKEENIKNMIYNIRGKRVILDEDIAKLFQYETKMLNRQVLRNIERFPENYCFQLTQEEYINSLRCQIGTLKGGRGEHRKYLPYAFTEYGVIMLTSILKSKVAIEASIKITNTFIDMRKMISEELIEENFYKSLIIQNTEDIKKINETLKNLSANDLKEKIFFDGEIYDAYSKIIDILQKAKEELIIIDGYADKSLLDIIRNINIPVTLITKNKTLLKDIDIKKYQKQYNNLKIIHNDKFHDRFIIIDKNQIYHLGTSLNHAGNKVFAINKIEEPELIIKLLSKISSINI